MVCMKTTLNLKDDLMNAAMAVTGIKEKTALVHLGLEELIKKSARERLAKMGGIDPAAKNPKRKGSTK
jgi:Arc/MetJ family transcription regulator